MKKQDRRVLFRESALQALYRYPGGAKSTLKEMHRILEQLKQDLIAVNALPKHFNQLNAPILTKLVTKWQEQKLSMRTMQNRMAVIRQLLQHNLKASDIPSNNALGIYASRTYKIMPPLKDHNPNSIQQPLIRDICYFEYLFGLKTAEAVQFQHALIEPNCIKVPRSISFNKRDRFIPIIDEEQRKLLAHFEANYPNGFTPSLDSLRAVRSLRRSHLKQLKLNDEVYRYLYVTKRWQNLLTQQDQNAAIKQLQSELGYTQIYVVKRLLQCLGNF